MQKERASDFSVQTLSDSATFRVTIRPCEMTSLCFHVDTTGILKKIVEYATYVPMNLSPLFFFLIKDQVQVQVSSQQP